MEKFRQVKVRRVLDKLAVPSEPGLTNAQLMLTNHDLKPGEYNALWIDVGERKESADAGRQWNRSVVNGALGTS